MKNKEKMLNNYASGIVLYNPEDDQYIESIKILTLLGVTVFVFDNSELEKTRIENENKLKKFSSLKVIVILSLKENIGLAAAFNNIVKKTLENESFKGLFLFDQDSTVNATAIKKLCNSFEKLEAKGDFGSVSGMPVRDNGIPYRLRPVDKSMKNNQMLLVKRAASSFSLINVDAFRKIGMFNEKYFIDYIDIDFTTRCRKANLPIYVDRKAVFTHNVGVGDVKILGKTLFPIANEYRHYYQTRNLILWSKFNKLNHLSTLKAIIQRLIVILIISIYAGGFKNRMFYAFKGCSHGFKGVVGKLNLKK